MCLKNGNQVATWKTSKSGFSLKDKKSKFLLKSDLRSRSTKLQAESDRRSIQELTGITDSQRMDIDHTVTGVSNPREINNYFKKKCQNKIGIFVKLVSGMCEVWKNCRKVTC